MAVARIVAASANAMCQAIKRKPSEQSSIAMAISGEL